MRVLWFALTPCGASEHLNAGLQSGGWLSALEQGVAASGGLDLHVCFPWHSELPPFTRGGVTYHPVRRVRSKALLLGRLLGPRFRPDPVRSYAEVVDRVQPDLIHVHGTEEAFGLVQAVTGIPVVVSIQGILSNICSKYFSGIPWFRFLLHERPASHARLNSVLSVYLVFRANAARERRILALARHVVGRTGWDRRSCAVLAPGAAYHHGDEILRAPFYQGAWSKGSFSAPLRIVTVTSNAPYKGFEAILSAARILRESGLAFTWTVAGLGPDDLVVRVAHGWLGGEENVVLLGSRSADQVRGLLLESDIFCQVSHIENSPNSLCEAMLLGVPVVATFAGGTDSMLQAGSEGILVQDGDPWSLAGAILELSRDFAAAQAMGRAARARARARHNPDRIVADLLATYARVAGDAGSPREPREAHAN